MRCHHPAFIAFAMLLAGLCVFASFGCDAGGGSSPSAAADDDDAASDDDDLADDDSATDDDMADDDNSDDDTSNDDDADDDVSDDDDSDDDTDDDTSDDDADPMGLLFVYPVDPDAYPGSVDFDAAVTDASFTSFTPAPLPAIDTTTLDAWAESNDFYVMVTPGESATVYDNGAYVALNFWAQEYWQYSPLTRFYSSGAVLLRYDTIANTWSTEQRLIGGDFGGSINLPGISWLYDMPDGIGMMNMALKFEFFSLVPAAYFEVYDPNAKSHDFLWAGVSLMSGLLNDVKLHSHRHGRLVALDQRLFDDPNARLLVYDGANLSFVTPAWPGAHSIRNMWSVGDDEEWFYGSFGNPPLLHRNGTTFTTDHFAFPCSAFNEIQGPDEPIVLHPGYGFSYLDEATDTWPCVREPTVTGKTIALIAVRDEKFFYFVTRDGADVKVHQYDNGVVKSLQAPTGYRGAFAENGAVLLP
ncbi:hypothetical protein K8I61_04915 [bacterium]|nr:hypothetical protein [bacterium]